ncbi:TPA: hypothetical protein N2Q63_004752 [Citrobacter freundii]|nr:hypothetical protein [Citrobacter freundii]HED2424971.1 hypothetical protein [Citrobacter freundii]HED3099366.1 hypothetical protein [Citrobacter freundii]HED3129594.1 hypothetical protein [Citrobacter freundii]
MNTIFVGDESPLSLYGVVNKINQMKLSQVDDKSDTTLMFGDSITQGLNHNDLHFKYVNLGIAGDTVHGIKKRIKETNISEYKAVFITAGTNNLLMGELGIHLGLEMAEAIDYAAPRSKILYVSQTFVPNREKLTHITKDFPNADYLIKKTCSKYTNCIFVPLPEGMIGVNGIDAKYTLPDATHLTGHAYSLWKLELNKTMATFPYSVYYRYFK